MFWQVLCLILLVALLVVARERDRLRRLRQPESSYPPPFLGPKPPPSPVRLTPASIDDFLNWVAAVPVSDAQVIRDQVALSAAEETVMEALEKALFELPVQDCGRHLLLLSTLGETRNPRAVEPLRRFLWLPDALITPRPAESGELTGKERDATLLETAAFLKARAAEMLAYMQTPEALDATLRAAAEHPLKAVRVAAMDAYLFNHGDDGAALERARQTVREDERLLVGLTRRAKETDRATFDAQIQAFYERHPEEIPSPRLSDKPAAKASPTERRLDNESPSSSA